ncbi:MAG: hypothetical protein JO060_10375 [Candidatus Eremiobacteraeota bacterium]|nr:hypothetical protein [Candidatus Eremiobacteraeota bacterium]
MVAVRWTGALARLALVGMLQACTSTAGPPDVRPAPLSQSGFSSSTALGAVAAVGDTQQQLHRSVASARRSGKTPLYLEVRAQRKAYVFSPFAQIIRSDHALIVRAYQKIFVFPLSAVSVRLHAQAVTAIDPGTLPRVAAPKIEAGMARYGRLIAKGRLDRQYHERMIKRKQSLCPDCAMLEINPHKFAHMAMVWNGARDPWQIAARYPAWPVPLSKSGMQLLAGGAMTQICRQSRTKRTGNRHYGVGASSGCSGGGSGSGSGGSGGSSTSGGSSSGGSSGSSSSGSSCSSGSSAHSSEGIYQPTLRAGRLAPRRGHGQQSGPCQNKLQKGCTNKDQTAGSAIANAAAQDPSLLGPIPQGQNGQEGYGGVYMDSQGNYFYTFDGIVNLDSQGAGQVSIPDIPGYTEVGWWHTHQYNPDASGGMQTDIYTGGFFSLQDLQGTPPGQTAYVAVYTATTPNGPQSNQWFSNSGGSDKNQGSVGSGKCP